MRFALLLIGVENVCGQVAVADSGNLPGEIHRIPNAGSHALTNEWGSEVGRVAENKNIGAAPPVGDLCAEGVLGDAQQCQLTVLDVSSPGRDQWPQCVQGAEVVGAFAGQKLKLPPVAGPSDAHVCS